MERLLKFSCRKISRKFEKNRHRVQAPFIATLFGLLITIWGSFKICPMLNIEKTKCFLLDLLEFNFGALLAIVARFFFQDHVTSRQIRSLLHVWLNFINKESGSFCHQTNENKGVNIPLFVFQFSLLYKSYVNYYVHYLYLVTGRTDMDSFIIELSLLPSGPSKRVSKDTSHGYSKF